MTTDLEFTHCFPCPSCGRPVAAGTKCKHHSYVGLPREKQILCPQWGGVDGQTYREPDSLPRLLERAAVLAARTGSPACRWIREAIEATKEEK